MMKRNLVGWAASFILLSGCSTHRHASQTAHPPQGETRLPVKPPQDELEQLNKIVWKDFPQAEFTYGDLGDRSSTVWYKQKSGPLTVNLSYVYSKQKNGTVHISDEVFEAVGPHKMTYKIHVNNGPVGSTDPKLYHCGLLQEKGLPDIWRIQEKDLTQSERKSVDSFKNFVANGQWNEIARFMEPKLEKAVTSRRFETGSTASLK